MRIDLHTHSSCSDGTDTPAELMGKAAHAGLDVIALTDHDTHDGIPAALAAAALHGVQLVPGVEISTQFAGESVHLLAYGHDLEHADLTAELARIRMGREGRVPETCRLLAELGVPITEADVLAQAAGAPSVGRPHFADALVAKGYVSDRREAFDRFLADGGPAYVHRYAPDVRDAIDLVHAAGGVAVLAHPWGRGRKETLTVEVVTFLREKHRLDGVEVWHQDHDDATRVELLGLANVLGLVPTGSSDHHGTGKQDHDLGVNLTPPESLEALLPGVMP